MTITLDNWTNKHLEAWLDGYDSERRDIIREAVLRYLEADPDGLACLTWPEMRDRGLALMEDAR